MAATTTAPPQPFVVEPAPEKEAHPDGAIEVSEQPTSPADTSAARADTAAAPASGEKGRRRNRGRRRRRRHSDRDRDRDRERRFSRSPSRGRERKGDRSASPLAAAAPATVTAPARASGGRRKEKTKRRRRASVSSSRSRSHSRSRSRSRSGSGSGSGSESSRSRSRSRHRRNHRKHQRRERRGGSGRTLHVVRRPEENRQPQANTTVPPDAAQLVWHTHNVPIAAPSNITQPETLRAPEACRVCGEWSTNVGRHLATAHRKCRRGCRRWFKDAEALAVHEPTCAPRSRNNNNSGGPIRGPGIDPQFMSHTTRGVEGATPQWIVFRPEDMAQGVAAATTIPQAPPSEDPPAPLLRGPPVTVTQQEN